MNAPDMVAANPCDDRVAEVSRHTAETQITVRVNLDGTGQAKLHTGIGFFDHMLDQIARHGLIDLDIVAKGDLHIDAHHTVEDIGITLGQAFAKAIGDKKGVRRYGHERLPTFGVGRDRNANEWRSIFRQLYGAGLTILDIGEYGRWAVTERGDRVLRGEERVELRKDVLQPAAMQHFGKRVAKIHHVGGYACRGIAGSRKWNLIA